MKILIVRFSSIGDIVLTTPIIRGLKTQLKTSEIHYLTKSGFVSIVDPNPYIDKVYSIEKSIDEVVSELKTEEYDWIIDLHNNIRTKSLKSKLKKPSKTFKKLNYQKWLLVNLKKDKMPDIHVVDRYYNAVIDLGIVKDNLPCDFYIEKSNRVDVEISLNVKPNEYFSIAIGAQFATKQLPAEQLVQIIEKIKKPVVLIGGETDTELAEDIIAKSNAKVISACGKYNLQQSADIVRQSSKILTNDTGMMHIASSFNIPVVSAWGNTVPSLGMFPYHPKDKNFSIHQVGGLSCRPCSKIGYQECPKNHFNCMKMQDTEAIARDINS